jgi:outer membrane protein TolC
MKRSIQIAFLLGVSILYSPAFQAQELEEYFSVAAENNPGLQAKYKMFEAALEGVPQANSLSDPTLSFGYFLSPVETRVGPQRARFSLSQMFPWFGTLRLSGDVAALNAEAKYQAFLDAKNALYYEVAAAYYPLFELQQWLKLEKENSEILRIYKSIATSKFENGEGTLVDVLRVDLMLKDSETNEEILLEKKRPLLSRINRLLNRDEFMEVILPDTITKSASLDAFQKDSIYVNHPLIDELDYRVEASQAQANLASKQGLPKIGVGLDYLLIDRRNDLAPGFDLADNGKDAWMPMVSVSIPIYRGKVKAAKQEAEFRMESYSLQKEDLINQLSSGYEMAFFKLSEQSELIDLYRDQISQTKQILNLLYSSYSNSGEDFEELLRMQQRLLKYEKMIATSLAEYQIALAELDYLTAKSK